MTMLQLQIFVTRYIRDETFRERVKMQPPDMRFKNFEFSKEELNLANMLDLSQLDRISIKIMNERKEKRRADLIEFVSVLQQVGIYDEFCRSFAQANTVGSLSPKVDAQRFHNYAHQYIKEKGLPKVLSDLATYSYQIFIVSQSALQDPFNDKTFNWDMPLFLKRPFKIKTFSYDLTQIIDNPEIKTLEQLQRLPKKRTTYFFQKDYLNPISSHVFEIDDPSFFDLLQKNYTAKEILQQASSHEKQEEWKELIKDIYESEIIGSKNP